VSDTELLDIGTVRRTAPPRWIWSVLLAAALVVAGVALLVDRGLREREDRAIAACADEVSAAVDLAGRRVQATYEYVRASFGAVSAPSHSEGLYLLIARSARHFGSELSTARGTCASIPVLPLHGDLRDRRDRCVHVLDAQRARLMDVSVNGERVLEWMDAPRSC
jgi:hypothetical protein